MLNTKIDTFLELCRSTNAIAFNSHTYVLPDVYLSNVTASTIPFEHFDKELRLKLKHYFSECEVQYADLISGPLEPYSVTKPIVLISPPGCMWYNPSNDSFAITKNVDVESERIFRNAVAYFQFFNFLSQDGICDYFNYANSEIVFYNSANGIIKVNFDPRPIIDFTGEITSGLNKLQELAAMTQITSVFVNSVFQLSGGAGHISLKELVTERHELIDITKRDYELISKKFDFAKFRNSLYAEKEKYFKEIREVVNKIFGQAIGVPISIGASVFATYRVQGDNFVVGLVLAGFVIYLSFYLRLQWIYKRELVDVENQFNDDFTVIAQNSGLPASTITNERQSIENKILTVRSIQKWLIGSVIGLGILVSIFMGMQFGPKPIEEPNPTIRELTEAIIKFNLMADSINKGAAESNENLQSSPEQFQIKVGFGNKSYDVNVQRISLKGHPSEYWATIPTSDSVLNKFPPVKYVVSNDTFVYNDSLSQILPGFAEKQKQVLLDEFKRNKWKF